MEKATLKIGQVWGMKEKESPWADDEGVTRAVIIDLKDGWVRYHFTSGTKPHSLEQKEFTDTYDTLVKEAPDADQS